MPSLTELQDKLITLGLIDKLVEADDDASGQTPIQTLAAKIDDLQAELAKLTGVARGEELSFSEVDQLNTEIVALKAQGYDHMTGRGR